MAYSSITLRKLKEILAQRMPVDTLLTTRTMNMEMREYEATL